MLRLLSTALLVALACGARPAGAQACVSPTDCDGDGISNDLEVSGYFFDGSQMVACTPGVDDTCFVTDPLRFSTDGDPYGDFTEVSGVNQPGTLVRPYSHPLVPARPVIAARLESYRVVPIATITDTNGGSQSTSFTTEASVAIQVGGSTTVGAEVSATGPSASAEVESNWSVTSSFGFAATSAAALDWSRARTTEPNRAARLDLTLSFVNLGSARAENVEPTFNVLVGDQIIGTVTPAQPIVGLGPAGSPSDRTEPTVYPASGDPPLEITLQQLRALQTGAPLTLRLVQIRADVPRWNDATRTWECPGRCEWAAFADEIDAVSARFQISIGARAALGQTEDETLSVQVFAGTENYDPQLTLGDALALLDGELDLSDDRTEIEGRPYPGEWYATSPSARFIDAWDAAGRPAGLLDVPIRRGDRVDLLSPSDDPGADVSLATFTEDMRRVVVAAWPAGGFSILSAVARVVIDGREEEVALVRQPGEAFYTNPVPFTAPASGVGTVTVTNALGADAARTVPIELPIELNSSCRSVGRGLGRANLPLPDDGDGGDAFVLFIDGDATRPAEAYCDFKNGETYFWLPRETGANTRRTLYAAAWVSDEAVYVVGSQTLIRSLDGGRTWTNVNLEGQADDALSGSALFGLTFRPGGTGIAVGASDPACTILRTTDGGLTWVNVACPVGDFLSAVAYAGRDGGGEVWVAVGGNRVLRSTDDGATWTAIGQTFTNLSGVAFNGEGVGMLTDLGDGANGVWVTADFGRTWASRTAFNDARHVSHVRDNVFVGDDVFVVSGGVRNIAFVDAGGSLREVVVLEGPSEIRATMFADDQVGFLIDRGGIYRTEDGGDTWTLTETALYGDIRALAVRNANRAIITADRRILQTTSGGGVPQALPTSSESTPRPGPELAAVTLHPPAPNPLRTSARIEYTLDAAGPVRLVAYDALGRQVAVLMEGDLPAGEHETVFDASRLASGVYLVRLVAGGASAARIVTVAR